MTTNNERVADTSKTIDHIVDVSKKVSLTEKWRKGELKEGYYYVTNKAHSIKFKQVAYYVVYGETRYWTECEDEDIEEVLTPVPSFEDWKSLNELIDSMQDTNKALAHRLNILKKLLKRCRDFINYEVPDHCIDDVLIDEIDEALK